MRSSQSLTKILGELPSSTNHIPGWPIGEGYKAKDIRVSCEYQINRCGPTSLQSWRMKWGKPR